MIHAVMTGETAFFNAAVFMSALTYNSVVQGATVQKEMSTEACPRENFLKVILLRSDGQNGKTKQKDKV